MGGQNCTEFVYRSGRERCLGKHGVRIIGVDIDAINITEDREEFKQLMETIDISCAPSQTATSYLEGKEIAQNLVFLYVYDHLLL